MFKSPLKVGRTNLLDNLYRTKVFSSSESSLGQQQQKSPKMSDDDLQVMSNDKGYALFENKSDLLSDISHNSFNKLPQQ